MSNWRQILSWQTANTPEDVVGWLVSASDTDSGGTWNWIGIITNIRYNEEMQGKQIPIVYYGVFRSYDTPMIALDSPRTKDEAISLVLKLYNSGHRDEGMLPSDREIKLIKKIF